MEGYNLGPREIQRALQDANVTRPSGDFSRADQVIRVEAGVAFERPGQLPELVVGVFQGRPVFLKDVATVRDGPSEVVSYVRHGWGPARGFESDAGSPGTIVGEDKEGRGSEVKSEVAPSSSSEQTRPAVTLAIAKQKGTNAVTVAADGPESR